MGIPVGVVGKEMIDHAITSKYANVSFYGWDANPWYETREGAGYIIFVLIIGLLYLFNIIISGQRITKWIYIRGGIDLNIGFLCLSLEFLCNVLRILNIIFYGSYNHFSIPGVSVLITLPFCITLITSIIIVFFWLDLTSDPFYHGKFLGIMKIPAGIFITGCVIVELVSDFLRNLTPYEFFQQIMSFYGSVLILVALFNFIAAFRVLRTLKKDTKLKLKRIIYRIIASGIATICGVIVFFLFLSTSINFTPVGWLLLWFFLYFTFWLQSTVLIFIFQVPKKLLSSTKATPDETTNNSNNSNNTKSTE